RYLAPHGRLHFARRKIGIEPRSTEERERVRTRRLTGLDTELTPHSIAMHIRPHRLRLAQKPLTLGCERAEVDAGQHLEARDVVRPDLQRFDQIALALQPLGPEWSKL